MPPRLRPLSGAEVIAVLHRFGFVPIAQRGSHVKLRRLLGGHRQTLTVPAHKELDRGTVLAILRQACRYVPEGELRPHFYSED